MTDTEQVRALIGRLHRCHPQVHTVRLRVQRAAGVRSVWLSSMDAVADDGRAVVVRTLGRGDGFVQLPGAGLADLPAAEDRSLREAFDQTAAELERCDVDLLLGELTGDQPTAHLLISLSAGGAHRSVMTFGM